NASINEQVSSHRQGGPAADGSLFSIWGPAENFLSTSVVGGRNRVFQQCAMLPNIRPIFCCSSDAHTSGVQLGRQTALFMQGTTIRRSIRRPRRLVRTLKWENSGF